MWKREKVKLPLGPHKKGGPWKSNQATLPFAFWIGIWSFRCSEYKKNIIKSYLHCECWGLNCVSHKNGNILILFGADDTKVVCKCRKKRNQEKCKKYENRLIYIPFHFDRNFFDELTFYPLKWFELSTTALEKAMFTSTKNTFVQSTRTC